MKFLIKSTSVWMIKNFDLVSIILVTGLTWLSRLDLSKSITLKDPLSPQSIFASDFVLDYPNGNLSDALIKFAKNDIILIYLYSHWDAESLSHKAEIIQVAEAINYKIPVVAVNCWSNKTSCFNAIRPNRFPQLYAYISNYFLVEYKCAIIPLEIFHFVNSLFYPFYFPRTSNELEELIKSHDATLIICLHSLSLDFSRKIRIFHQIASLYQGRAANDPNIGFIVLSEADESHSDFRHSIGLSVNEIVLFSASGLNAKYQGKLLVDDVIKFLSESSVRPVVSRYAPTGMKSRRAQELFGAGVTILYVDRGGSEHSWRNIVSKLAFHSFALHVRRCSSDQQPWYASFNDLVHHERQSVINWHRRHQELSIACRKLHNHTNISPNFLPDIPSLRSPLQGNNSRHFSDYLPDPFITTAHLSTLTWLCRRHAISPAPLDVAVLEAALDGRGADYEHRDEPCTLTPFNRSIAFSEIDGRRYPHLLHSWGLSLDSTEPQVVVIDWKNEIISLMPSGTVDRQSLDSLLDGVLASNLTAHLRVDSTQHPDGHSPRGTLIRPLGPRDLEAELADPGTDLLVYYYTPWCAYCSSLSSLLIMLARYFAGHPDIHFCSVDTANNDLPWKYQSERVPSLILYPRGRKSESATFALSAARVSLGSLVRFVLEHSGDPSLSLTPPGPQHSRSCDRRCLQSALHTVQRLHSAHRHALASTVERHGALIGIATELCLEPPSWPWDLRQACDYPDYSRRRLLASYRSSVTSALHGVISRGRLIRDGVRRLRTLARALRAVLDDRDSLRPAPGVEEIAARVTEVAASMSIVGQ